MSTKNTLKPLCESTIFLVNVQKESNNQVNEMYETWKCQWESDNAMEIF
jgi:hypothetical protein